MANNIFFRILPKIKNDLELFGQKSRKFYLAESSILVLSVSKRVFRFLDSAKMKLKEEQRDMKRGS